MLFEKIPDGISGVEGIATGAGDFGGQRFLRSGPVMTIAINGREKDVELLGIRPVAGHEDTVGVATDLGFRGAAVQMDPVVNGTLDGWHDNRRAPRQRDGTTAIRDERIGVADEIINGEWTNQRGDGYKALGGDRRNGGDAIRELGTECKGHAASIGEASDKDALRVDGETRLEFGEKLLEELAIINIVSGHGLTAIAPNVRVSDELCLLVRIGAQPFGENGEEVLGIGLLGPAVGLVSLFRVATGAVEKEDNGQRAPDLETQGCDEDEFTFVISALDDRAVAAGRYELVEVGYHGNEARIGLEGSLRQSRIRKQDKQSQSNPKKGAIHAQAKTQRMDGRLRVEHALE
jgi:hypothetical protein